MLSRSLFIVVALLIVGCKQTIKKEVEVSYASFGDSITADDAISKDVLFSKFKTMKEGDTLEVKFASKISDVCQKKGCWMNVDLSDNEKVFVKFKDYSFFMPLNSAGEEAVINGKAFLSIESVEEQKHYAKDAGKSQEAIDSITTPIKTYAFMANGVLIKNNAK